MFKKIIHSQTQLELSIWFHRWLILFISIKVQMFRLNMNTKPSKILSLNFLMILKRTEIILLTDTFIEIPCTETHNSFNFDVQIFFVFFYFWFYCIIVVKLDLFILLYISLHLYIFFKFVNQLQSCVIVSVAIKI